MNYKKIAKEIYAESMRLPNSSASTRYRRQAVKSYSQDERYYINAYMDQIAKSNHVAGRSPSAEFNERRGK